MIGRAIISLLCAGTLLLGGSISAVGQVKQSAADIQKFGVYPIAYRELITRWLEDQLIDPASAIFEWPSEPKRVVIKGRDDKTFAVWRVDFKINSRNKFGTYTGKQARHVYIRNAEVFTLPQ